MENVDYQININNIRDHLIHNKKMCFLNGDVKLNRDKTYATVFSEIESGAIYLDEDNFVSEFWLIEFMAQAVAALYDIKSGLGEKEMGFLISIDKLNFYKNEKIGIADKVRVNASLDIDVFPFGVYKTELFFKESKICDATMKFMIDKEGVVLSKTYS